MKSNDASDWTANGISVITKEILTTQQAYDVLAEKVAENCCWGESPLKKMIIESGWFSVTSSSLIGHDS